MNTQLSSGFVLSSSIDTFSEEMNEKSFIQIAKIFNDKHKNLSLYEFSRRSNNLLSNAPNDHIQVFFSTKSQLYLDKVSAINISIVRTLNSSSPCLRSIRVLGVKSEQSLDLNLEKCILKSSSKCFEEKRAEIPEEFVDELTHDMMRMPIKLPSQKYIDKSTLDIYLSEKRKINEKEKDPFTCVEFSSTYKPIIDEELKSKIDKFMFENHDCVLVFKANESNESEKRKLNSVEANLSEFCGVLANDFEGFQTRRPVKKIKSDLNSCNSCLNVKNSARALYELSSCKHVFCRHCLLAMNNKCRICKRHFKNNQIVHSDRTVLDTK